MSLFIDGLDIRSYVTQSNHYYLAEGAGDPEGPNIGANGENLTITFLSLNRSTLSERLCKSIVEHIPDFAGEILAVDNGSSEEELRRLDAILQNLPFKTRLEVLGQNFGVAGGRNRTIPFVKTQWVMSLDNDVIFVKNPLLQIQKDIAQLGCHFLTMAVLNEDRTTNFIRGGHLWLTLQSGELVIGGGSAKPVGLLDSDGPGYLGTFMSGCASVFRIDTFEAQGGFDEGMFVGFEDFEFSLRLFRAGLKVGASDFRALVHDHPRPDTNDDKHYERARFARDRLLSAARHFEAKHGFRVWTPGVDGWVAEREQALNIAPQHHLGAVGEVSNCKSKPSIALIVDRYDWALANIAGEIEKYLSDDFDFEIIASSDLSDRPEILSYITKDFDLCHYLWREPLHHISSDWTRNRIDLLFGGWASFKDEVLKKPKTCSVYDHLFLDIDAIHARWSLFNENLAAYTVSSAKLDAIYRSISSYPNPTLIATDGVDLSHFVPMKLNRFDGLPNRALRIGWVGNSQWGGGQFDDAKGFHTILKPAIAELANRGLDIDVFFADRNDRMIARADMPEYYSNIDLLCCTSSIEGTPNPILESMACGVPVVSTDVGIVPEVLGSIQSKYILEERSVKCLADSIQRMIHANHFRELSNENLLSIKSWNWAERVESFREFFKGVISNDYRKA